MIMYAWVNFFKKIPRSYFFASFPLNSNFCNAELFKSKSMVSVIQYYFLVLYNSGTNLMENTIENNGK